MTEPARFSTADLCDEHGDVLQVAEPVFLSYGGATRFHGRIHTLRVHEDFGLVKQTLQQPVDHGVLVVDGGGSLRCALLGDRLAAMAIANGWSGAIVNGCIRDAEVLAGLAFGVKALNTNPSRPRMDGAGESGIAVTFAGVTFRPGGHVYSDHDGIVVSTAAL